MDLSSGPIFRNIYSWIKRGQVSSVKLTGIRASKVPTKDFTPDYQFTIGTTDLGFLETDAWIHAIGDYFVCIYDQYVMGGTEIETRLVLFTTGLKVQFLFPPDLRMPNFRMDTSIVSSRPPKLSRTLNSSSWKTFNQMLENYN